MKFLKATVATVATMTLLPFLIHTSAMEATNSSLPYCNRTDDNSTTAGEVCLAIYNALNKIDDLCSEGEIVSWVP